MDLVFGPVVALVFFGLLFAPLERFFHARPRVGLFARGRLVDVAHWLVGGPLARVAGEAAFFAAMVLALPALTIPCGLKLGEAAQRFAPFARLPIAVQIPVALAAVDFFAYWGHRAMHSAMLWRWHAVHHSPRELDWLSAARNHPLGEAIGRVLGGVPLLFLGVDGRVLAGLAPVLAIWALFLHVNVRWTFGPLKYVIATPLFHRWHHARDPEAQGKNFAAFFPVWDLVFGTFHAPDRQPAAFGVDARDEVPETFLAQLAYPFRRRRA
jgi:sterol desaturase/sphingolipid hydroxylase (fatty acid hydroxylase superfamily)